MKSCMVLRDGSLLVQQPPEDLSDIEEVKVVWGEARALAEQLGVPSLEAHAGEVASLQKQAKQSVPDLEEDAADAAWTPKKFQEEFIEVQSGERVDKIPELQLVLAKRIHEEAGGGWGATNIICCQHWGRLGFGFGPGRRGGYSWGFWGCGRLFFLRFRIVATTSL